MNILFSNRDGSPAFKLVKQDPGFELLKWTAGGETITKGVHKGKTTAAKWKKMAGGNGLYPHSIRHAGSMIVEDFMLFRDTDVNMAQLTRETTDYLSGLEVALSSVEDRLEGE